MYQMVHWARLAPRRRCRVAVSGLVARDRERASTTFASTHRTVTPSPHSTSMSSSAPATALLHHPVAAEWVYSPYSMAIPEFDHASGLLPLGTYAGPVPELDEIDTYAGWPCTLDEIRDRFVARYPASSTRAALFRQVESLIAQVADLIPCSLFLLSGGFVTDLDEPSDLHLVLVAMGNQVNALSTDALWLVDRLFQEREQLFGESVELRVTTQFVRVFPSTHQRYPETLISLASARLTSGLPAGDDREGGYVQFLDCEGGDDDDQILGILAGATAATDAA